MAVLLFRFHFFHRGFLSSPKILLSSLSSVLIPHIPGVMLGPLVATQTLSLLPCLTTCWADPAGVKSIPYVFTETRPAVVLTRLPSAVWTTNAQPPITGDGIGMWQHSMIAAGPTALEHPKWCGVGNRYDGGREVLLGDRHCVGSVSELQQL